MFLNVSTVCASPDSQMFYEWLSAKHKLDPNLNTNQIVRSVQFNNFLESQTFVNQVSNIAEQENHHPDILFGWGYCKIKIFTHAIKGLAESDFILAAKIDKI